MPAPNGYVDPFEDYSSSGSIDFTEFGKKSVPRQPEKLISKDVAGNLQSEELIASLRAEISELKADLHKTESALKDKSVAKEILDGNLKRILNAVNKLSAEKKALAESNQELQRKLEAYAGRSGDSKYR